MAGGTALLRQQQPFPKSWVLGPSSPPSDQQVQRLGSSQPCRWCRVLSLTPGSRPPRVSSLWPGLRTGMKQGALRGHQLPLGSAVSGRSTGVRTQSQISQGDDSTLGSGHTDGVSGPCGITWAGKQPPARTAPSDLTMVALRLRGHTAPPIINPRGGTTGPNWARLPWSQNVPSHPSHHRVRVKTANPAQLTSWRPPGRPVTPPDLFSWGWGIVSPYLQTL